MRHLSLEENARRLARRDGVRYELIEKIGSGGVGTIFRAREVGPGFPREVCIKRLILLGAEQTRELREEARLLSRVRHSNVVSLLGMGEEPSGAPFLVLELVKGYNLRALCRGAIVADHAPPLGYMADRVAVHVACALLRALGAVERAIPGLVHRDVSPTNILVSNEGEVKLTDFGIALALDRARWTNPSLIKGKLGYMSPEQVRGGGVDPRADLFAVGVVLYELLARRRPWVTSPTRDELGAIGNGDMLAISACRPDLHFGLKNVLDRLLAFRAQDRYACADDALRALASYSAGDLSSLRLAALVRALDAHRRGEGEDDDTTKCSARKGSQG